ncbi:MAG: hypothetical protein K6G01_07440 [Eubacterium sp.]|nr:hypothetical protein [Eubacterium sp.]
MKKKLLLSLVVFAFSAFALVGCSGDSSSEETTQEETADAETDAEETGEDVSSSDSETSSDDVWSQFTYYYAGITDDESTYMYLALNDDNTYGCALFYDSSSAESGSWVGEVTTDEDNSIMTISDENNGTSLSFSVEQYDDGYLLDMGDVGSALVGDVDGDSFAAAANAISEGTEPQF